MIQYTEIRMIASIVAMHYGMNFSDLCKKTRKREIVQARQMAFSMIKLRYKNRVSLDFIGRVIGGKDHATVGHGIKTIENLCDTDIDVKEDYDNLKLKMLNEGYSTDVIANQNNLDAKNIRGKMIAAKRHNIRYNVIFNMNFI